jgi:hypothetical protein
MKSLVIESLTMQCLLAAPYDWPRVGAGNGFTRRRGEAEKVRTHSASPRLRVKKNESDRDPIVARRVT